MILMPQHPPRRRLSSNALVTRNRASSRMVAYPECSQQLESPGMEKLALALWWRFHLMRQFVAIFSSHGVLDSHLMGTRSI